MHWAQTEDPRVLRCPTGPFRRQASWDDAGELYPPSNGGPNILVDLNIPSGDWVLSLYFVNIDAMVCPAHWRTSDGLPLPNRFRDYLVEVRRRPDTKEKAILASCRVTDFCGGVYSRFRITGGSYTLKVARQRSHNTILSAVFLDPASAKSSLASAVNGGMDALRAVRLGTPVQKAKAVPAALALRRAGCFEMARELLASIGRSWAFSLASKTDDQLSTILADCENGWLGIYRQQHVPAHERFLRQGHDPDRDLCLPFVPLLRALNNRRERELVRQRFSERLAQRPELAVVYRAALRRLPDRALPDFRAVLATQAGDERLAAQCWLRYASIAPEPGPALASSLRASLCAGDLPSARKTLAQIERLPEADSLTKLVRWARGRLAQIEQQGG
jgi:hypothetical protein